MPVFNIRSKTVASVIVSNVNSTTVSTVINGVTSISENLSHQIGGPPFIYGTLYRFVPFSLEIFINGIMMLNGSDFIELSDFSGFRLIQHDVNLAKILRNSLVVARYTRV